MDKDSKSNPVNEALDTIMLIRTLVKDIPDDVSPSEAIFWVFKALVPIKYKTTSLRGHF